MHNTQNLAQLRAGAECDVVEVSGTLAVRLAELGFVAGTRIRCENRRARGGLAAYLVRGSVIALRERDARGIRVC
jgi:ferrous iron transport protein A